MRNQIKFFFFFSSRRRHTRSLRDWSSDVCSSDLEPDPPRRQQPVQPPHRGLGRAIVARDRKSVVKGKSVDLGGRRIIKKKKITVQRGHYGAKPGINRTQDRKPSRQLR